ncbi:MAG: hypothetical protein KDK89_19485 [Alphaproteobacteria bacterium]|nr:hypothetical protein [Alphaproteobacteria bacterium]
MKKHLLLALILCAGVPTVSARAEVVDVATVKCSEISTMSGDEGAFLFTWLLGYIGGQNGVTTMDLDQMETIGKDIGEYCAANPDVGVLSAAADALSE